MAACIVCNAKTESEYEELYMVTSWNRLARVIEEAIPVDSVLCPSCQSDLEQLEMYYCLLNTVKMRYRRTAEVRQNFPEASEALTSRNVLVEAVSDSPDNTGDISRGIKTEINTDNIQSSTKSEPVYPVSMYSVAVRDLIKPEVCEKYAPIYFKIQNVRSLQEYGKQVVEAAAATEPLILEDEGGDGLDLGCWSEGSYDGENQLEDEKQGENLTLPISARHEEEDHEAEIGYFSCGAPLIANQDDSAVFSGTLPNASIIGTSVKHGRPQKIVARKAARKTQGTKKTKVPKSIILDPEKVKKLPISDQFHVDGGLQNKKRSGRLKGKRARVGARKCVHCEETFFSDPKFIAHNLSHNDPRPFKCATCGKGFSLRHTLETHHATHTFDKREKFICRICGKALVTKSYLKLHMALHTGNERYRCTICDKGCVSESIFKTHMLMHQHIKKKPDIAMVAQSTAGPEGSKSVADREITPDTSKVVNLPLSKQFHITGPSPKKKKRPGRPKGKSAHVGARKCVHCGMEFSSDTTLLSHSLVHNDQRPFKCATCGKGFRSRKSLSVHNSTHEVDKREKFTCTVCGKTLVCKSYLKQHMAQHAGNEPFRCTICDKGCVSASSLKIHMMVHTGERPYSCMECGAAFTYAATLKAHMTKHTGDRPFKCECGMTFCDKTAMTRHMKTQMHAKQLGLIQ